MAQRDHDIDILIGDNAQLFTTCIEQFRARLTKDSKDLLIDHHNRSLYSSYGDHPVLPEQHSGQPARWLHIKLRVLGDPTSSITLFVRDDNVYVLGFKNQYGVFQLRGPGEKTTRMLPYKPSTELHWGVKYRTILNKDSNEEVLKMLESRRLGKNFAKDAVKTLSRLRPLDVAGNGRMNTREREALGGLIFIVCESARMNRHLATVENGWNTGATFDRLLVEYVWNWKNISHSLLDWKESMYSDSEWPSHGKVKDTCKITSPGGALEVIHLVLNWPSWYWIVRNAQTGGDQSRDAQGRRHQGREDGSSRGRGRGPVAGNAQSRGQYGQVTYNNGTGHGRSRVEILAVRVDFAVVGMTIAVLDGIQGQILYRHVEQEEEDDDGGDEVPRMVDLVLTGPYIGISAYGRFAIHVHIPGVEGGSSSSGDYDDADNPAIEWEWDGYDPAYASEVDDDEAPKPRIISPFPGRIVEVTYRVMSNALEASLNVKLLLGGGRHSPGVYGMITARVDGLGQVGSVLFSRRTQGTGVPFSPADSPFLPLARSVVAVPFGWKLCIDVDLHILPAPDSNQGVKDMNHTIEFTSGHPFGYREHDGDRIEVNISWYPKFVADASPETSDEDIPVRVEQGEH